MYKKIAYSFYLVLAVFVVSEFSIRAYRKISQTPALQNKYAYELNDDHHYPRPYVMAAAKPFTKFHNSVHNILGYRDDLPVLPKPQNEFRVFVIGGSTVHGEQVPLTEILNGKLMVYKNKKVRFYNFGSGSSISRQDVIRILIDLAGYSPDYIIHYGGGNDIYSSDHRVNFPHRFVLYENNYFFNKNASLKKDLGFLLSRSELLKFFAEDKLVNTFFEPPVEYFTDSNHLGYYKTLAYASNISIMAFLSQNLGVKFMAIFQPLVELRPEFYGSEIEYKKPENDLILKQRDFLFNLMGSAKFSSTPFVDCSHIFDSVKLPIFRDVIHVNAEGQKTVADCIFANFEKNITKPITPTKPVFLPEDFFITGVPDLKAFLLDFANVEIKYD